jgi:glycosyltransferase involved in cell wall biosynthesis
MKLLVFTPVVRPSSIGRDAALVVRMLATTGHDVSVVRTEKQEFFADAAHGFGSRPVSWTDRPAVTALAESADACIYQIGDNEEFHRGCLEWMPRFPGIVSLHDIFVGHLFSGWAEGRRGEAEAVARFWYGEAAAEALFRAASTDDFIEQTHAVSPMTEWICAMARGVIIHSGFGAGRVLASCPGPVYQVPLPVELPVGRPEARPAGDGRFRVLTVGHVNPNKRAESVIRAIGSSEAMRGVTVYRLVGKIAPARRGHLADLADACGVTLEISGEVDDAGLAAAFAEADAACCMRWPGLEGASSSTIETMLWAKPAIVTNAAFYSELPDDCVIKINPEDEVASCRAALERLHGDHAERRRIGEAARVWAGQVFSPANYADNLIRMARETNRLRPVMSVLEEAAANLRRWGASAALLSCSETLDPLRVLTGAPPDAADGGQEAQPA